MERDRDYLYHCNGCHKEDKEYPDKEVECDECLGEDVGMFVDADTGECWKCNGDGKYLARVSQIDYHQWARSDAYGIYTGLYCDKCYKDSNIYTYRKDEYFDPAYAGERMEDED